jgi:hypothetical protein
VALKKPGKGYMNAHLKRRNITASLYNSSSTLACDERIRTSQRNFILKEHAATWQQKQMM